MPHALHRFDVERYERMADPLVDGYQGGRIAAATETIVPREYPDVSVSLGRVFGIDA